MLVKSLSSLGYGALSDQQGCCIASAVYNELLVFGQNTARKFERGEARQILLKDSNGVLIITPAGPNAVLAVLKRHNVNLGLVFLDLDFAAQQIYKRLSRSRFLVTTLK